MYEPSTHTAKAPGEQPPAGAAQSSGLLSMQPRVPWLHGRVLPSGHVMVLGPPRGPPHSSGLLS